ncbi:MAG TPA: hypothetical protein PKA32_00510 [Candidatus Gracilibacteria bacterium]|nr:hypothetical protein [Candidatus Gracilibacteria bacterium]
MIDKKAQNPYISPPHYNIKMRPKESPFEGTIDVSVNQAEANKQSGGHPFEGTVDVSLEALQQGHQRLTPAPFHIGRDVANGLLQRVIQGHNPSQETVSIRQGKEEQTGEPDLLAFARWYREFPINFEEVVKQYQLMRGHMDYALTRLGETIPQEIETLYAYVTEHMNAYHEAQMAMMRSSSPDINQLKHNVFTDEFALHCTNLLNQMKELGESLYLRRYEQKMQEQRHVFQASGEVQEVGEHHPFLADRFETNTNPVEKAKREYQKAIKSGIGVDCDQAHKKLGDTSHIEKQHSFAAVAGYIQGKTLASIDRIIESANLPDEAKIHIYQQLPKAIHSFSTHSNEHETASYLRMDRIIERSPQTDHVLKAVIAALVRGLALTYAAYKTEEENQQILWAYSYALRPEHIHFSMADNTQYDGSTVNTVLIRYPKTGNMFTKEGFFDPLNADKDFLSDYLPLAMLNTNLGFVCKQIRDSLNTQASSGAGAGRTGIYIAETFKLTEQLTANRKILEGLNTEAKPEGVTYVDHLDDAVARLNNLRLDAAMAIHALMQKIASLEEERSRQDNNLGNQKYLLEQAQNRAVEQGERAKTAEESLKNAKETIDDLAGSVMRKCNEISNHADRVVGGKAQIKELALELSRQAQELKGKK